MCDFSLLILILIGVYMIFCGALIEFMLHKECNCPTKQQPTTTAAVAANDDDHPLLIKKQDVWKEHICSIPCIDCNQLLIACTNFSAEGACILYKSRCNYVGNYSKREEYSLCEPGCLNCLAMRYGCYYHQDPGLCITYNDYCLENSMTIADDLKAPTSSIEQEFIEELLRDYEKSLSTFATRQRVKHANAVQIEDRSCADLNKSCKTGKSFMNYLDCLEWFIKCNI